MAEDRGQLIVQLKGATVLIVPLTEAPITLGREPDNDVVLDLRTVSRRHARLEPGTQGALLTDLRSTYGTLVNGKQIVAEKPEPLTDGMLFQIAEYIIMYRAPKVASAGPPQAIGAVPTPTPVDTRPARRALSTPTRPTVPAPAIVDTQSRYLFDLPVVFHDNEFLGRFLLGFEALWEPLEQRQDYLPMYFDPLTCPVAFLPWLASWLGFGFSERWSEDRRRALLNEAMDLYSWRGTNYGLTRLIELCTDLTPTIAEAPDQPCVIVIRLRQPAGVPLDRSLLEELIQHYKPAHMGYRLELEQ